MHVASDAEFRSRLLDRTDGVDAFFICLAVDGSHLAFVECDAECLFSRCRDLTGIGAVGKCLLAVKGLFAADARSPQTFVDGIFHFLIVGVDSVFFEIVYLIFACECHVAGGSDDLYLRSENLECEIKTHLVVAGSG